jgi:hypothetical protein
MSAPPPAPITFHYATITAGGGSRSHPLWPHLQVGSTVPLAPKYTSAAVKQLNKSTSFIALKEPYLMKVMFNNNPTL